MPREPLPPASAVNLSASTETVHQPDASSQITIVGVKASSAQPGYAPVNVIDDQVAANTSRWLSAASDPQPTLIFELDGAAQVGQLVMFSGYMNGLAYQPQSAVRAFRVEAETGGEWLTVAEVDGNDDLVVRVPFAQVTTRRLRIVITRHSSQDTIARVFEVYLLSASQPEPPRRQRKPNLTFRRRAQIENAGYQVTFYQATWSGASTIVHDLAVRADGRWVKVNTAAERFGDQWLILRGHRGSAADYYGTMCVCWVTFDDLDVKGDRCIELRGTDQGFGDFRLTWDLDGARPRLTYRLTAAESADHVIGYQSFTGQALTAVEEVLCGPLQHAKVVLGRAATPTWKLTGPFSLTQRRISGRPLTVGVFVPADHIPFENDHHLGPDNQRYGMCLIDDDDLVRPVIFEPHLGYRSRLAVGETHVFTVGLVAEPATLAETYERLLRSEYGYRDYRENVFGQSMTDTMYNLIDLMMLDSGLDDSVDFRPSPSGWWSRAKGFIDIENPQSVRVTAASVLLEAYLLTGDDDVYDRRALPTIEFHLSRNGYGWTPRKGYPVYGDTSLYKMGSVPFDASTLAPLYAMTGGRNQGIRALAEMRASAPDDYWLQRAPWSTALALYRMTADPARLRDAEQAAQDYIASQIEMPYETNASPSDFQYYYARAWTELLELYETTGRQQYLDAAHAEARRFASQVFVRPVPEGEVTAPVLPVVSYTFDWTPSALCGYAASDVTPEQVPGWVVSTNGATFEALGTFEASVGGYILNPAWAPFLLRLADHVGDRLLADVASNLIVGRYTSYPGYYNRQFMPQQAHPDFPLRGPAGIGTIYHSHMPAQLGMTIDWLLSEQTSRSRGAISFPSEFEANYVWFKYHTYGHRPGVFYGDRDVWLWMPRGIVALDNPQVNWVSAEGNGKLYLSLTNASARAQHVTLTFGEPQAGIRPDRDHMAWIIRDNGPREPVVVKHGRLRTSVSAKGITAVIVAGATLTIKLHQPVTPTSGDNSFHFDDDSPIGIVRGMLLVKPDLSRYDAYIQAATESPATLHYSTDGGKSYSTRAGKAYPNEWTVPVYGLGSEFRYYVRADGRSTSPVTLSLAP